MRYAGRQAFTLIEVLVVVAIITLLAAILLPALQRARELARQAKCLSNLKTIGSSMGMYQASYRGWLPVGPVDRMKYVDKYVYPPLIHDTPEPNTEPFPSSNCHWGGKRAAAIHDFAYPPREEELPRPLTSFMYPGTGLDHRTPVFECPSDQGSEKWDPQGDGRPYYEICGNSYWTNNWSSDEHGLNDPFPPTAPKRVRAPSVIVVTEEAPMFLGVSRKPRMQLQGWHGRFSRHSILFLDFHAVNKYVDTRQYHGPGWQVVQYWDIMDFYR